MKKLNCFRNILPVFTIILLVSCKKQDGFLNQKPSTALSTISTINDVQNLLNNEGVFNHQIVSLLGEEYTDDYYLDPVKLPKIMASNPNEFNLYTFQSKTYPGVNDADQNWDNSYNTIYYANNILDALPKIIAPESQLNSARGQALFFRSFAFYYLVQTFAMPYDSTSSKSELGIPLRLSSNLNLKSIRSSEEDCYQQIINDLQNAINLLPANTSLVTLPTKTAGYALLARVYLGMNKYGMANKYANLALSTKSNLTDYNELLPQSYFITVPSQFPLNEDIFHSYSGNATVMLNIANQVVDSTLYNSYDANDLRKSAFFTLYNGHMRFRGTYDFLTSAGHWYTGLATDEMFLIRAETYARLGNISMAMGDLNALLVKRYTSGTYITKTASSVDDALTQILLERRKELLFRGLRWEDMRRLSKDSKYAITINRTVNGVVYALPPNDPRYAMEIPPSEINVSGIPQNKR